MRSGVLGERVILDHGVEVDGVRGGVVAPVARGHAPALLEERQGDRHLRERQILDFDQRLQREAVVARLVDRVGDPLERRQRAPVVVRLAACGNDLADEVAALNGEGVNASLGPNG